MRRYINSGMDSYQNYSVSIVYKEKFLFTNYRGYVRLLQKELSSEICGNKSLKKYRKVLSNCIPCPKNISKISNIVHVGGSFIEYLRDYFYTDMMDTSYGAYILINFDKSELIFCGSTKYPI